MRSVDLKRLFLAEAQQRAEFATGLQAEIRRLGAAPETSGSVTGSLHRGWINLKSALGGGDHAIVTEAERGEDAATQAYEEALRESITADVRAVIERQYMHVNDVHDRIRRLRDVVAGPVSLTDNAERGRQMDLSRKR